MLELGQLSQTPVTRVCIFRTKIAVKTVMAGSVIAKALIDNVVGSTVCMPKILVQKLRGRNRMVT